MHCSPPGSSVHGTPQVSGSYLCRPGDPKAFLPGEEPSALGKACFAVRSGAGCYAMRVSWVPSLLLRGLDSLFSLSFSSGGCSSTCPPPPPQSFCRPRELGLERLSLSAAHGPICRGYSLHRRAHWTNIAERLLQASGTETQEPLPVETVNMQLTE